MGRLDDKAGGKGRVFKAAETTVQFLSSALARAGLFSGEHK